MSGLSYSQLLKMPQWQQMRLRVMDRAGFKCEQCGNANMTLNVHHTYYEKGKKPWEYPAESLKCLCEPCHEKAERLRHALVASFGLLPFDMQERMLATVQAAAKPASELITEAESTARELLSTTPPSGSEVGIFTDDSFGVTNPTTLLIQQDEIVGDTAKQRARDALLSACSEAGLADDFYVLYIKAGVAVDAPGLQQKLWVSINGFGAPRVVAMGSGAKTATFATCDSIGKLRGRWHKLNGKLAAVTYSPVYLVRNPMARKYVVDDLSMEAAV